MTAPLVIKIRVYKRPDGRYEDGDMVIDNAYTLEREKRHRLITDLGLRFTAESFPGFINLCLEDDVFDYKFEVVQSDTLWPKILEIIDNFSEEDYTNTLRALTESEIEVPIEEVLAPSSIGVMSVDVKMGGTFYLPGLGSLVLTAGEDLSKGDAVAIGLDGRIYKFGQEEKANAD